jgi:dienelactone hydrolase
MSTLAAAVLAGLLALPAQADELDAALNESVQTVTKRSGGLTVELETTVYRPEGDGPFPLVVINHGKAPGDTRAQSRYRPANAARYFLQRGYVVVAPMRQGFSRSSGSYAGTGCNVESNGRRQADDVRAVLDHFTALPWIDKDRILVVGQSHGGWTTLAFGTQNYPGVKGLVNFAGGLRQETCAAWKVNLAEGAGKYGRRTRVPSLWFYGENDSYFDYGTSKPMHLQYTAGGANARMVAFGPFGRDAHNLFASAAGTRIWQPEMTAFLASIGMPSAPLPDAAKYGTVRFVPTPPATDYAPLADETRLPYVRETGRAAYKAYLGKLVPRAFAVSPNGAWGWAEGGADPLQRALDHCNRRGRGDCRLYSVDDQVVWKQD